VADRFVALASAEMHQWPPIAKSAFWSKRPSRLSKSRDPLRRKSCTGTRRASHAYGAMSGHYPQGVFYEADCGAVMVTAALTAPGLAADLGARSYTKAAPAVASVSNWSDFLHRRQPRLWLGQRKYGRLVPAIA
jgi:hypothetical protein